MLSARCFVLPSLLASALLACSGDASLIDRDALTRACAISAGCGIQQRPSVQGCVDFYFDVQVPAGVGRSYASIYRCVLEAKGACERVLACFGAGEPCDNSYAARCDGARALSCDLLDKRAYTLDCGASALSCAVSTNSFAAECRCDEGLSRCEGGWALRCAGGQVQADDCATNGMRCDGGRCVASSSARSCEGQGVSCEGDVAVRCEREVELRVDCAALPVPHRCEQGNCVPRNDECDDDFNRCSADGKLEACLIGRWTSVDCAALGFDACLTQDHGANCASF